MKKFYLIFALFTLVVLTVTAQPQLTWRFNNVEVINAGTQLQFDVEVKANVAGSYQRDLQIYFDYNTLGFGSNIVAGGKITYTPLTLMDATKYVVVNMADNTSSKFAIITEAINEMSQPGSATYYTAITTSYQGFLRFNVTIAAGGNNQTAGIAFDQTLMNGGQYYQSTSNTDPLKYIDPSLYENNLSTQKLSSIYGTVKYMRYQVGTQVPLKLSNLTLYSGATPVDTYGPTTNNGIYYFTGMNDGSYTIQTTCTNWTSGGITNTDATLAQQIALLIFTPTALQFKAADVAVNNAVNNTDVTMIKRRVLLLTTPAWNAPLFVFEVPTISVSSGLGTSNYLGLLSGDVNGSYNPPL
jgi:hypothetical protein